MKTTRFLKLSISVGVILALTACNATTVTDAGQNLNHNPHVTHVESSWSALYALPSLAQDADLIVEGKITGIQNVERVGYGIYTDYVLEIDKTLKSDLGSTERSIVFRNHGGTLDGETQVVEDNEPFVVGERVLLFLSNISDVVVHTPQGQTKYNVMLLGGRFQIKADDTLDSPATGVPIASKYRGKPVSILEKDILTQLPTPAEYVKSAAGAFLIVEGRVNQVQARQIIDDDTQNIYTYYSFTVDKILQDQLVRAQNAIRKSSKVYDGTPVKIGDVITIIERGGVYQGVTERHTWSQFMSEGTQMVLFLGAMSCGDLSSRGTPSPLCSTQEQEANKILYMLGGGARFRVGSDNRLTSVTHNYFSSLYDGAPKTKLFQGLREAKRALDKELDAQPEQSLPSTTE